MITIEKMLWSFIKFSQLILKGNVWRSVWRICMWILGLKGLITYTKTQVWDLIFFIFLIVFFKNYQCAFLSRPGNTVQHCAKYWAQNVSVNTVICCTSSCNNNQDTKSKIAYSIARNIFRFAFTRCIIHYNITERLQSVLSTSLIWRWKVIGWRLNNIDWNYAGV